jgi:hypothetical protein
MLVVSFFASGRNQMIDEDSDYDDDDDGNDDDDGFTIGRVASLFDLTV